MKCNWKNRTLWIHDNLEVLKGMNSGTVDFTYLDPPFFSQADYKGSRKAKGMAFTDIWNQTVGSDVEVPVDVENFLSVFKTQPPLYAYLFFMALRIVEIHRLLAPTGCMFLHCDDNASHYLKVLSDAVFGRKHFRNAITWVRSKGHNDARRFGRITDDILYYVKSKHFKWYGDRIRGAIEDIDMHSKYPSKDARGRYRFVSFTAPGKGRNSIEWHGFDPMKYGRMWSVPLKGAYALWIEENVIPGYRAMSMEDRLEALYDQDMIILPTHKRKWPSLKHYMAAEMGGAPQNLVMKPTGFTNYWKGQGGQEYIGYPTQKPLGLIRPLIIATTDVRDRVLDPFCGSGTTLVAADIENRRWAGIDNNEGVEDLLEERLGRESRLVLLEDFNKRKLRVKRRPPKRTDS